jgi:4-hydroxy-tetrahydrodipicolinate synthase
MLEAMVRGEYYRARDIVDMLSPLHMSLLFVWSPAPAKYACSLLNLCADELRLPMTPCTEAGRAQVRAAMTHAGLI